MFFQRRSRSRARVVFSEPERHSGKRASGSSRRQWASNYQTKGGLSREIKTLAFCSTKFRLVDKGVEHAKEHYCACVGSCVDRHVNGDSCFCARDFESCFAIERQ